MVTFTAGDKSCDVSYSGKNQVELNNRLISLRQNQYLADAIVNTYHRLNKAGFQVKVSFADQHGDRGQEFAGRVNPTANSSSFSFKVDGIRFAIARIRVAPEFNESQNAWWSIEISEQGRRIQGHRHNQFLVNGENFPELFDEFYNYLLPGLTKIKNQKNQNISHEVESNSGAAMNLNTIKYGPPGTGKTYSLINDIKTLLQLTEKEDETEISSIADLKHRFGHRIEFLTFHQSYSYEDFIEGIKAEITETQQVNYAVKNGIFKKISRRAYLHKIISFENTPDVTDITEQLIQLYAENTDQTLKMLSQSEDKLNVRARKILDLINDATNKASLPDTPKYVLCIDEINRGNLSRIFGELITCIEKTKRHGGGETIPVTLPYSGDLFVVPDNLYIIGTMNTADRSLVKLDNAMRRRFNFQLIKPDASLLETTEDDVNLENFLNVVNGRIRERLGIDFELGHAYFMGINNSADFEMVIKNNIIPLLNEYFFNNNASVQEILRNTDADQYLDR